MHYCLRDDNYKHVEGTNLWHYVWQVQHNTNPYRWNLCTEIYIN